MSCSQAHVYDIAEILLKVGLNTYTQNNLTPIVGESLAATSDELVWFNRFASPFRIVNSVCVLSENNIMIDKVSIHYQLKLPLPFFSHRVKRMCRRNVYIYFVFWSIYFLFYCQNKVSPFMQYRQWSSMSLCSYLIIYLNLVLNVCIFFYICLFIT